MGLVKGCLRNGRGSDSVLRRDNGGGLAVPGFEVLPMFLGLLLGLVREGLRFWFCLHSVKGCGAQSLCDWWSLAVGLRKVE